MSDIKLIVGLGNPGSNYEQTRHNMGFQVVREVAKKLGLPIKPSSLTKALSAESRCDNGDIMLLLPQTYMNCSGPAVAKIMSCKDIELQNILVVCDDIDLEFGRLRLRSQGSTGGHNGLKSIAATLNTTDFARLRIGIGHPGSKNAVIDFVLEKFTAAESKALSEIAGNAADCCMSWFEEGIEKSMSKYNSKQTSAGDGTN